MRGLPELQLFRDNASILSSGGPSGKDETDGAAWTTCGSFAQASGRTQCRARGVGRRGSTFLSRLTDRMQSSLLESAWMDLAMGDRRRVNLT
jgi:hypothetical protein